jgi:hypothetical protein
VPPPCPSSEMILSSPLSLGLERSPCKTPLLPYHPSLLIQSPNLHRSIKFTMARKFFVGGNFKMNPASVAAKKEIVKVLNEADLDSSVGAYIAKDHVYYSLIGLLSCRGRDCTSDSVPPTTQGDRPQRHPGRCSEQLHEDHRRVHGRNFVRIPLSATNTQGHYEPLNTFSIAAIYSTNLRSPDLLNSTTPVSHTYSPATPSAGLSSMRPTRSSLRRLVPLLMLA